MISRECQVENIFYDVARKAIVLNGDIGNRKFQFNLRTIDEFTFRPGMDPDAEMAKLAGIYDEIYRGKTVTVCSPEE